MSESCYCAVCDVTVQPEALLDGWCPYCGTEIPEAVEGKMPNLKTINDARRHLVDTLGAILDKQLGSDTVLFSVGRRGQGMSIMWALTLLREMRRGGAIYTNFDLSKGTTCAKPQNH